MRQLLLFFMIFTVTAGFAQTHKTLATFTITDATTNGVDQTARLVKAGAYAVFYTLGEEKDLYMANVWPNNNSQSFGPVQDGRRVSYDQTEEAYKADYLYFNWHYTNSYNAEKGIAKVTYIQIYKPQSVSFTLQIIPESRKDTIVYKGEMDAALDLSDY